MSYVYRPPHQVPWRPNIAAITTLSTFSAITGAGASTSIGAGIITGVGAVSGASAGISEAAGSLTGVGSLTGEGDGLSSGAAIIAGVTGNITGSGVALSIAAAPLPGLGSLAGGGEGTSIGAAPIYNAGLNGAGEGLGAGAGSLTGIGALSGAGAAYSEGAGAGVAVLFATLSDSVPLNEALDALLVISTNGGSAGLSRGAGVLSGFGALSGGATAPSEGAAPLVGTGALTGGSRALSEGAGQTAILGVIPGASAATSIAAASLVGIGTLSGSALGPSSGGGTPLGLGSITGAGAGYSVGVGPFGSLIAASGSSGSFSIAAGQLVGLGSLQGASEGETNSAGPLVGVGGIARAFGVGYSGGGAFAVGTGDLAGAAASLSRAGGVLQTFNLNALTGGGAVLSSSAGQLSGVVGGAGSSYSTSIAAAFLRAQAAGVVGSAGIPPVGKLILPLRSSYSRTGLLPIRSAMALALRRRLERLVFNDGAGGQLSLARVYEAWPGPDQQIVLPSACVLPGRYNYGAARLTPTLMEDTWEPKGMPGWGLYKTSDFEGMFDIVIRCPSDAERDMIWIGLEEAWVADQILMDHVAGARYGVLEDMPEYWGVTAEFALRNGQVLDDADSTMRNVREVILTVAGTGPVVKLAPVVPMHLSIRTKTS